MPEHRPDMTTVDPEWRAETSAEEAKRAVAEEAAEEADLERKAKREADFSADREASEARGVAVKERLEAKAMEEKGEEGQEVEESSQKKVGFFGAVTAGAASVVGKAWQKANLWWDDFFFAIEKEGDETLKKQSKNIKLAPWILGLVSWNPFIAIGGLFGAKVILTPAEKSYREVLKKEAEEKEKEKKKLEAEAKKIEKLQKAGLTVKQAEKAVATAGVAGDEAAPDSSPKDEPKEEPQKEEAH